MNRSLIVLEEQYILQTDHTPKLISENLEERCDVHMSFCGRWFKGLFLSICILYSNRPAAQLFGIVIVILRSLLLINAVVVKLFV